MFLSDAILSRLRLVKILRKGVLPGIVAGSASGGELGRAGVPTGRGW
jgi:hypothetical protein